MSLLSISGLAVPFIYLFIFAADVELKSPQIQVQDGSFLPITAPRLLDLRDVWC